jgi:hypothetical protein
MSLLDTAPHRDDESYGLPLWFDFVDQLDTLISTAKAAGLDPRFISNILHRRSIASLAPGNRDV